MSSPDPQPHYEVCPTCNGRRFRTMITIATYAAPRTLSDPGAPCHVCNGSGVLPATPESDSVSALLRDIRLINLLGEHRGI